MIKLLKGTLNKLGFDIKRKKSLEQNLFSLLCALKVNSGPSLERHFLNHCIQNYHDSKAQLMQDLMVDFFYNNRPGVFCEFGATDGVSLSNTWFLEKKRGWTGILAEPAKKWQNALVKNRPNSAIDYRCVYSSSDQKVKFSETDDGIYSTINEFIDNKDALQSERKHFETYDVKTVSLNRLLVDHAVTNLDFLSVDTEGSEFLILKEFDFNRPAINIVCVEHNYLDNRENIFRLLSDNQYIRIFTDLSLFDDWYIQKDFLHRKLKDLELV